VFSIAFFDEPPFNNHSGAGELVSRGQISVDDFQETFLSSIESWSKLDYERQWVEGVRRVVDGEESSCLITYLNWPPLDDSRPSLNCYAIFRLDDVMAVQDHLILLDELDTPFDPVDPYSIMGSRDMHMERGKPIGSEWKTSLKNAERWLRAVQPASATDS
jgi:hypothetical protein